MRDGARRAGRALSLALLVLTGSLLTSALVTGYQLKGYAAPLPPAVLPPPGSDLLWDVRGALHVHSAASMDGYGSIHDIALAASRARLAFVAITDHQSSAALSRGPVYENGVLLVAGEEIGTDRGHLVCFGPAGFPHPPREAVSAIDAVHAAGGIALLAHPTRAKKPWRTPVEHLEPVDGLEIENLGDIPWGPRASLWRQARAVLLGLWRPDLALLSLVERPDMNLALWDRASSSQRTLIATAGVDAHGLPPWLRSLGTGYETPLGLVSNHVLLNRKPTGDASKDSELLLKALAAGRAFVAWDVLGSSEGFRFWGERKGSGGEEHCTMGDTIRFQADWRLRVEQPRIARRTAEIRLLRDGDIIVRSQRHIDYPVEREGCYRVEIWLEPGSGPGPRLPWIFSNQIRVVPSHTSALATPTDRKEALP